MQSRRNLEATAIRAYRGFLWLYPAAFRDEYAHELCLVFADRWRERSSATAALLVWLHAVLGVLSEAPKEHYHMMVQDIRYALRVMRKDAGVTAAAIAILGLGIGSATLVFSLANGLLIKPLPYSQPDRIVAVQEYSTKDLREAGQINYPNFIDMRARTRLLGDMGAYGGSAVVLRGDGLAERVPAGGVTSGVFRVLGVTPLAGRIFTETEDLPNGPKSVIISESLWQRRFGRDPKTLGRSLDVDGDRYSIVGVMPSDFHFPDRAELWVPMQIDLSKVTRTDYFLHAIARLKPGISIEQATSELESMLEQIHHEHPESNNGWKAKATDYREYVAGSYRKALIALLVAVGLLLTIACANVSNLLLVKASARVREMAVRTALGASRTRLVRLLVSESLLLGIAGSALGLLLAYGGIPALLSLIPIDLPRWMNFSIDYRVLFFALAVCLLTSLAFGIAPAFASSGIDITAALKEAGRGSGASLKHKLLRNGLVVAELAISVMLLAGAGLMIRSFLALRMQNLGFQPENVITMRMAYPDKRYPDGAAVRTLLRRLTPELSALPGMRSVAFSTGVPLSDGWGRTFTVEGKPLPLSQMPIINHIVISPGYFRTLGIPLLAGRDFTDSDFDSPNIVIIAESFAKKHWPGESALGKRIRFGPPKNNEPWHTVVGIAADNRHGQLKGEDRSNVYLPYYPDVVPSWLLAHTSGDPQKMAKAVQSRIRSIDSDIALSRVLTLEQIVTMVAWQDRFWTVLLAVFSALALLLAAVGLYAVLSYTVSLNTHEIGIRMALGASASNVRGLVMRQGMALAGGGLIAGILGALAVTRLLKTLLYQVSPRDPVTYIAAPIVLLLVALAAALLPTRRAIRVDPVVALRHE